jgi:pimeloyl-ACP methyl ester carboxylesterase
MPLTENYPSMIRSPDRMVEPVRAPVARCTAFDAAGRGATGSVVATLASALLLAALSGAAFGEGQILRDVVFTDYGDRSSNQEIVRRMLSPLAAARLGRELARSGRALAGQPVDLSTERYVVYLPSQRSASGYGLLVFVPPWPDARIPPGWAAVLDRFGLIFVSAARSGNEESSLARREPLALLAAENAIRRYPVDLERVYVAGFSGGSRIALRLALGYPDLFRGAILNAGSDPIGSAEVPLPPRELFLRFQNSTRVVYVTGERDGAHAIDDLMSVRSLRHWCVFSADSFEEPHLGHEVATATALSRALVSLTGSERPDAAKVAACQSVIDSALDAALRNVASMIEAGRDPKARQLLKDTDEQFGGLAAPRSLALASRL